jgi:hypothetical protein
MIRIDPLWLCTKPVDMRSGAEHLLGHGRRSAIVMSLVQSAKLHGHDPWTYLRDVLMRIPTQLNSRIDELLPHN